MQLIENVFEQDVGPTIGVERKYIKKKKKTLEIFMFFDKLFLLGIRLFSNFYVGAFFFHEGRSG